MCLFILHMGTHLQWIYIKVHCGVEQWDPFVWGSQCKSCCQLQCAMFSFLNTWHHVKPLGEAFVLCVVTLISHYSSLTNANTAGLLSVGAIKQTRMSTKRLLSNNIYSLLIYWLYVHWVKVCIQAASLSDFHYTNIINKKCDKTILNYLFFYLPVTVQYSHYQG